MYVDLVCQANHLLRAGYRTQRAAFATVGVDHNGTFDFTHNAFLFLLLVPLRAAKKRQKVQQLRLVY